ncbi:hypothetical protein GSI_12168 [Ganoderma sinense ZZ0214-1]|uniref:Uncharacterized protein n=1 Tax=Ganoderma sinense ZZ0214-1 TaxID=1077348 RepID=A0A2G8RY17_9APHY|nr:hypothetical protein GSI_12168 [Ganoderma sinense ZZ0214-1]
MDFVRRATNDILKRSGARLPRPRLPRGHLYILYANNYVEIIGVLSTIWTVSKPDPNSGHGDSSASGRTVTDGPGVESLESYTTQVVVPRTAAEGRGYSLPWEAAKTMEGT